MSYTRNEFIKLVGLSGLATLTTGGIQAGETEKMESVDLRLGMASYTFRNFKLNEVITMAKRVGLTNIALKSMHMPLESSGDEIKNIAGQVRSAGLNLYGAGVIYMKTAQEVENAFTYARNAGLEMIVGVPNHDLLPLANEQVKKYNIKLAVHNHGPGDDLYSSVNDVYNKIKDLDKRIGFCIDIGHVKRIKQDPVAMIEKYKDRLYDMHMKDVNKDTGDGVPVEVGRGIIDIPGVIKALNKIKYTGTVAFEYEKDGDDPLPGLAESVGYVRGVMKMV
ncbi:MAG TPA: sugar phosphate isomerase/epimerase [Cyclobacteriaceae bacterium]|nr:sugar phosphate isomerase/epimerase [Cyclobacteriaceae bacterium]